MLISFCSRFFGQSFCTRPCVVGSLKREIYILHVAYYMVDPVRNGGVIAFVSNLPFQVKVFLRVACVYRVNVNLDANTTVAGSHAVLCFLYPCDRWRSSQQANNLRDIYRDNTHHFVQRTSEFLSKLYMTTPDSQKSESVRFCATKDRRLLSSLFLWRRTV